GQGSWMCCVGGCERPMNILLMSRCCRCRKRLAKALIRLARNGAQGGKSFRDIAMSQAELGKVVNASRENVNKLLADWKGKGIVSIRRGVVKIADAEGLEELAESRDLS